MAYHTEAVEKLHPNIPREPRPSVAFSLTPVQPYAAAQRNSPADVRLLSPTFTPAAKMQWPAQYDPQDQSIVTAASEQLETVEPKRNIPLRAEPLSPTLYNTGARAGGTWPATGAPTQDMSQPPLRAVVATSAAPQLGVTGMPPTIAAVSDVGGEGQERLPSLQLVDGGIRVLGGHASDSDSMGGALTCVLMYMTIVVVAVAMVLIYFFRSLYAEPPKMTPFDYEEEEAKQARKKPLTTTVRYEEERAATGPLQFARKDKGSGVITTHGPETRDVDGGGIVGPVTSDTGYADEVSYREDGNMTAMLIVTPPDKKQESVT